MTKKVLFLSAAVVLLAAGCNKATSMQTNSPAPAQSAAQPTPTGAQSQTSLKALMAAGSPVQCMFNNNQTQGTVYVANGKMRGDFTESSNGQTKTSHMINDGTNIYTWLDGMGTGFKMSDQEMMAMGTSTPTTMGTSTPGSMHRPGIDPNAQENYNCSAWTVDASVFTPPSSVTFSDMMDMMKGNPMMMHGMHGGASSSAGSMMMTPPPSSGSNGY